MKTGKQKKAGFTLVELMVVAIIVAILAAVAIPLMTGNKERAAATEGQAGCSTIATALRMYVAENGGDYPDVASGEIDEDLPGINDGDLNGSYFNHNGYAVEGGAGTYTITATARANGIDADIAGKTVVLEVANTGRSTWSGSLID